MVSLREIPASPLEASSCVVVRVPWIDPRGTFSLSDLVACPWAGNVASMNTDAAATCHKKMFKGAIWRTTDRTKVMCLSSQKANSQLSRE